jgi:hypothetical protein
MFCLLVYYSVPDKEVSGMASDLQREAVTPEARGPRWTMSHGGRGAGEDIGDTRWNRPSSAPSLLLVT